MKLSSRILAVVALLVAALGAVVVPVLKPAPGGQALQAPNGKVVVIGMAGVPWELVGSGTPNLAKFAQSSAVANQSVRTFELTSCADSGWLTLNTGVRTRGAGDCPRRMIWEDVRRNNASNRYKPQFGSLARAAESAGKRVAAVGEGAQWAIMDDDGRPIGEVADLEASDAVARAAEAEDAAAGVAETGSAIDAEAGGDDGSLAEAYRSVAEADLVLVDAGSAYDPSSSSARNPLIAAFSPPTELSDGTHEAAKRIDGVVGRVLGEIEPGTAVVLTSLGDSDPLTARLQYVAIGVAGEERPGRLTSASTRQVGIIQNVDVHGAILQLLGANAGTGQAGHVSVVAGGADIAGLQDLNERALWTRAMVGPFYVTLGILGLAALAVTAWRVRASRKNLNSARRPIPRVALLIYASLPAASFLVNLLPWWQVGWFGFVLGVAAVAGLIGGLASLLRSPVSSAGAVAAITALTIGVDAMAGSPLHSISVLGDQPQSGGRFYGISNAPFAVWAVAMLFLAGWFVRERIPLGVHVPGLQNARVQALQAERELGPQNALGRNPRARRLLALAAFALIAIVVDGAPGVGADFGGPPALIVGFGLLALLMSGSRISVWRVLGIGALAVGLAAGISFADWLRPASARTHLGVFFQSVIDGEALGVIARKAEQLFGQVPLPAWVLAAAAGALLYVAWRWVSKNYPVLAAEFELRYAGVAVAAAIISATFINDSGLTICYLGAAFALPLWLAAGAQGFAADAQEFAAGVTSSAVAGSTSGTNASSAPGGDATGKR